MSGLILLIIVILVVWILFARRPKFVEGFSRLLQRPVHEKLGPWSYVTGAHQLSGEYEGRQAALTFRRELDSDMPGYLIVSMEVQGDDESSGGKVSIGFPDSIRDSDGQRAMYDLVVKHDVTLALDGRWLKVTWMPMGFIVFPGPFEPERWRNILRAMRRVVQSLESSV